MHVETVDLFAKNLSKSEKFRIINWGDKSIYSNVLERLPKYIGNIISLVLNHITENISFLTNHSNITTLISNVCDIEFSQFFKHLEFRGNNLMLNDKMSTNIFQQFKFDYLL